MKTRFLAVVALSTVAGLNAQAQFQETTNSNGYRQMDFDQLPAGPVTLAQLNAAFGTSLTGITLSPSTAAAGVYNTNPQEGRALALDAATGTSLELIDPPAGAFTAFDAQIDLGQPSTRIGIGVGDWVGAMNLAFFSGGQAIGTYTTSSYGDSFAKYIELIPGSGAASFDRVDITASTAAGNWVITRLAIEDPRIPTLAGSASLMMGAPLDTTPFRQFEDSWFITYDALDPLGTQMGDVFLCYLNFGVGGDPATGNYPQLPGFIQLVNPAQNPAVGVFNTPPAAIGVGNAFSAQVPPGTFQPGDTLRVQGLRFDPAQPGRIFDKLFASNVLRFEHRNPVTIEVKASGSNSFNSDTSAGFFSVENVAAPDIVSVEFDWVNSPNPGQGTMTFDTDQTGMADIFEGGNSTSAGCLGTYRNGSDVATGLIYDAQNTVNASPCDPAANTGWIGTNPSTTDAYRTLQFRFAAGTFLPGQKFEVDIDTDGGAGITGEDMDGMVVTITLAGGTQLTGSLTAVPGSGESVLRF